MKKTVQIIFLSFLFLSFSQNSSSQRFENGDRVCFIGNSITHAGDFHHNIMQYYVTRFPEKTVTFFNCGIGGDVTAGVLRRLESDILVHKPTCAVIMIGMNDVGRNYYRPYPVLNADTLQKREAALNTYRRNLDSIVSILRSKKIKVILQKPSIFDETAKLTMETKIGCNGALKICADHIQQVADKYKLQTVDYWTIMTKANQTLQQKDPTATIVGRDRVHPGPQGHFVMAYQFLKTTQSPEYVSKMVIGKKATSATPSINCLVSNLKYDQNGVTFSCKENALPFTLTESQQQVLPLVNFTEELNKEILQVNDLSVGDYELKIDSVIIGKFSNELLKAGVNLALIPNTPQYRQSLLVKESLSKLWGNEVKLRNITLFEFGFSKDFKNTADFGQQISHLDSLSTTKYATNDAFKRYSVAYKANKPNESALEKSSDELRTKIYVLAQPKVHAFKLTLTTK